ncbi:hypothetical protein D3C79_829630 [compost metagenome]
MNEAMDYLNALLVKRYKTGTYVPLSETDPNKALAVILLERRKQLLFRGLRWLDLRRLNTDARFATTLKRTLDGVEYLLPPNDNRYTFPIPNYIIAASGMQQNQ